MEGIKNSEDFSFSSVHRHIASPKDLFFVLDYLRHAIAIGAKHEITKVATWEFYTGL